MWPHPQIRHNKQGAFRALSLSDAVLSEWFTRQKPFTGTVERRDPASYQRKSIIYTCVCPNPACRVWTMHGSWKHGRCSECFHPLPADFLAQFR